jgi:hypothetical protein
MSSELTTNTDGSVLANSASSAGAITCSRRARPFAGDNNLVRIPSVARDIQGRPESVGSERNRNASACSSGRRHGDGDLLLARDVPCDRGHW